MPGKTKKKIASSNSVDEPRPTNDSTSSLQDNKSSNATEKKSKGSNTLLWIVFIIVTSGLSFGFKTILEENNQSLVQQIKELENKIAVFSKSQVDSKAITKVSEAIPELEKSLAALKQETNELWKFLKPLPSSISNVKTSLETLEESDTNILEEIENLKGINSVNTENIETTRQSVMSIEDNLHEKANKFSSLYTKIEEISEDVNQISASSKLDQDKISTLESNFASMSVSVSKVEGQLNTFEKKSNTRFANDEKNRKTFEEDLSKKTLLLESSVGEQMTDMLAQVQSSKTLSDNVKKELTNKFDSFKREFSSAFTKNSQQSQQAEQQLEKIKGRLDEIDATLEELEADQTDNAAVKNDEKLVQDIGIVTERLRQLEATLNALDTKSSSQYDILFKKFGDSNKETTKLRTDVNTLLSDIKKFGEEQKKKN